MRLCTPLGVWGSVGLRRVLGWRLFTVYYPLKPHDFGTSYQVVFRCVLVIFST